MRRPKDLYPKRLCPLPYVIPLLSRLHGVERLPKASLAATRQRSFGRAQVAVVMMVPGVRSLRMTRVPTPFPRMPVSAPSE